LLIDGAPVDQWDLKSLRRHIGIVSQEPLLFQDTIQANIAYGRPDATDEEIIAAAQAAQAHDFIMSFPDGYDTEVGVRGTTLSGGQRQRVAIARAILLNPRILILDDSTSSVDMKTEYLIQQALTRLMAGRTTFVIAQRLSTVKRADQVIVMDHGRIIERGSHEELLTQNGLYSRIYAVQMADRDRLSRELRFLDMVDSEDRARGLLVVEERPARNGRDHGDRNGKLRQPEPAERRTTV
jgi:ABC-type multidrug transport system fused ATPase/permease subunit